MGIIFQLDSQEQHRRKKMKLFMLLAVTLLFVGYVHADETEDLKNLAEDDDRHHRGVNHLVVLAVKYRHQYRMCIKHSHMVKKCHRKLHHWKRVYHHIRHRVHRVNRVLRHWHNKYRHCIRFCWWRRRRGDESPAQEEDAPKRIRKGDE